MYHAIYKSLYINSRYTTTTGHAKLPEIALLTQHLTFFVMLMTVFAVFA